MSNFMTYALCELLTFLSIEKFLLTKVEKEWFLKGTPMRNRPEYAKKGQT